jgi:excinuclease UvrABC ATPase subunit
VHHFLRLLYMKLGVQHCPDCGVSVEPQSADQIVARLIKEHAGQHIGVMATLVNARKGYYTDLAKWASAVIDQWNGRPYLKSDCTVRLHSIIFLSVGVDKRNKT